MDVRQLRYFVRVIELKSFSRAAEVLHIAQPALGLQIRKLEEELHTQLMVRHSRGVEPTDAGKLLHERVVPILRDLDDVKQTLRDFSGPPRGAVRLGISPSTYPQIATELVQRAAIELPAVDVVVHEAMNSALLDQVRAEQIELALVYLAGDTAQDCSIEVLGEEDAVFVQGRRADAGGGSTIRFADMCRHALVMPRLPHQLRRLVQATAQREGIAVDIAFEMESHSTVLEMVERNMAGCVAPFGAVAKHVMDGRLHARTITEPRLPLRMAVVSGQLRVLSKAELLLRSLLARLINDTSSTFPAVAVRAA